MSLDSTSGSDAPREGHAPKDIGPGLMVDPPQPGDAPFSEHRQFMWRMGLEASGANQVYFWVRRNELLGRAVGRMDVCAAGLRDAEAGLAECLDVGLLRLDGERLITLHADGWPDDE